MKNKIDDLRNHLFGMIEDLRDPETEVDLDRCKLVVAASESIINSAKVEVSLLTHLDGKPNSAFFQKSALPPADGRKALEDK